MSRAQSAAESGEAKGGEALSMTMVKNASRRKGRRKGFMTGSFYDRNMDSQREQIFLSYHFSVIVLFLSFFLKRLKPDGFSCDVDPMDAARQLIGRRGSLAVPAAKPG
jgi:hypothetical protein